MYAGKNNVASFNESFISFGSTGFSDDTPSRSSNTPSLVKNRVAILGRKYSKSA